MINRESVSQAVRTGLALNGNSYDIYIYMIHIYIDVRLMSYFHEIFMYNTREIYV